jgi:hypothetical protein
MADAGFLAKPYARESLGRAVADALARRDAPAATEPRA